MPVNFESFSCRDDYLLEVVKQRHPSNIVNQDWAPLKKRFILKALENNVKVRSKQIDILYLFFFQSLFVILKK